MSFDGFQATLVLEGKKASGFHDAQLVDQGIGGLADQLFFSHHGFGDHASSRAMNSSGLIVAIRNAACLHRFSSLSSQARSAELRLVH